MISSLSHSKTLDFTKLKAFAEDIPNMVKTVKFVSGGVENSVENAGHQYFLHCQL